MTSKPARIRKPDCAYRAGWGGQMVGTMDSLQVTDAASAAVATHPRVKLDDITAAIADKFFLNGADYARSSLAADGVVSALAADQHVEKFPTLSVLTTCILVMKNGFTVVGKAAPASPENFNADLGRQYAYEDAVRQLWPLMGFALRDKLAAAG
jgi:hypothetical protein